MTVICWFLLKEYATFKVSNVPVGLKCVFENFAAYFFMKDSSCDLAQN